MTTSTPKPPPKHYPKKVLSQQPLLTEATNYYSWHIMCNNCGHSNPRHILKGVRAKDVIKSVVCDNCGVNCV